MKKFILVKLFILCSVSYCLAQVNADSLRQIWNNENLPDTTRLDALDFLTDEVYLFSNPDSGVFYYQALYDYAKEKGLKKYMGLALGKMGTAYMISGKFSLAQRSTQQGLEIQTELHDTLGICRALNTIAGIYLFLGECETALTYFQRVLEINKKQGNSFFEAGITAGVTINMTGCLLDLGKYDSALASVNRGIELATQLGNKRYVANGLDWLGEIYHHKSEFDKAKSAFKRAIEIETELMDEASLASTLAKYGQTLNATGEYSKAVQACEKSYQISSRLNALIELEWACNCLYEAHKQLKHPLLAFRYHEEWSDVRDSLQKQDASKQLQYMEFQKQLLADSLATAEKERLVQEAHEQEVRRKNQTRNILVGGGILVLLLAGGIYSRLRYTRKAKDIIEKEKDRSENLLLNILPEEIARELKEKGKADARDFDRVSILFTDFKDFTQQGAKLSAAELVNEINHCFEAFDAIMEKYGIEKIKTIGDAYMAAGGLPVPADDSVKRTILAALEMQEFISKRKSEMDALGKPAFEMRVGIHTGPVVAGIVGVKKFQYDIWGDTVNTASRIESMGEAGKVNISKSTYELIKDDPDFSFEHRGQIEAKGKGEMEMWFVSK